MADALFDMEPVAVPEPQPKLSQDRRRTLRQRQAVENGVHPLALVFGGYIRVDRDPARTCGNCRFRVLLDAGARRVPKCTVGGDGWSRVTHSAATDVRAWWPACTDHEWGDAALSPDAARSGPL